MTETWNISLRIYRHKEGEAAYFEDFSMEVNPDEYVLDAVERAWSFYDRTICFRHACHYGVEKLKPNDKRIFGGVHAQTDLIRVTT
jgi:hypothetical protein